MKNLYSFLIVTLVALSGGFFSQAQAGVDRFYTSFPSNVAVEGYDPVAYFTEGRPVKGSTNFKTTYEGAEFRFSNEQNLKSFIASPDKYAPQYGGYCAWAVSQGYTAKGDANSWRIVDGKLYLNYSPSIQRRWNANIPGFIQKANVNWPKLQN